MFKNRKRKGFTLIELVIVIAIIGILAAIAVPRFTASTEKAQNAKIQANARTLASAISTKYAEDGKFPTDDDPDVIKSVNLTDKGYTFTCDGTTKVIAIKYTWNKDLPQYTGKADDKAGITVDTDNVTFNF